MNEAVKLALAYLVIGFFVATVFGCCFKERGRHLASSDTAFLLLILILWPAAVLAVPVVLYEVALECVETTRWWKRLPASEDLYPVEWLFCWPVKLYELWRKRHGRQKRRDE